MQISVVSSKGMLLNRKFISTLPSNEFFSKIKRIFYDDLISCQGSRALHTKTRKLYVYNTASELYNELLEIYFDKYSDFSDA